MRGALWSTSRWRIPKPSSDRVITRDGGLRYKIQEYIVISARAQAQMLLLTSVAMIIPALFHFLRPAEIAVNEPAISLALAGLPIVVYIFSLIFSLHTHKGLFRGASQEEAGEKKGVAAWSLPVTLVVLGIATFFISWLSEILVGSVEQVALHLGMFKVFVGIIIVAVIGNAAEHSTAVMAAMKNRTVLSAGIAFTESMTQIAQGELDLSPMAGRMAVIHSFKAL